MLQKIDWGGVHLSLSDPFVIVGFSLLVFLFITAIVLLACTQRRSAKEIWDSVKVKPKYPRRTHTNSSTTVTDADRDLEQGPEDTVRLIMASPIEGPHPHPLASAPTTRPSTAERPSAAMRKESKLKRAKAVRFSSVVGVRALETGSYAPLSGRGDRERLPSFDTAGGDLGNGGPVQRISVCEQQRRELCFW